MKHAAAATLDPPESQDPPDPIKELSELPYIINLEEMIRLVRKTEKTIRGQLQAGRFPIEPFMKYPYRWRKDDVIKYFKGAPRREPKRPHGFRAKMTKRS